MAETVPLGDLVSITRGTTYKSTRLGEPGPVLLGLASIARNGGFRGDSLKTYGGESPEKLLVHPGELYASLKDVTQSADLLGSVARVPLDGPVGRLTQDTVRLDIISNAVDPSYLYLSLLAPEYRAYCRSHSTGTTNLGLPREDFLSYQIRLPSLAEQRRIAGVLGALDDLIETNRVQLDRMLEAARLLFRRFSAATESRTFGDVVTVGGGGTPSTKIQSYWDGDIAWATPSDLTALPSPYLFRTSRMITGAGLEACASPLYPPGSILMTSRATIGVFALAQVPTAVNQGFIVVSPTTDADCSYLLLEMMDRVPDFLQHANGSTFLELSRGRFKNLPVEWPSVEDRQRLHTEVGPLLSAGAELQAEISELTRARDELLPLLMSGRVRVREVA